MDSRRKAEIEAKKQKLAELKRARLERQATLADSKSGRSTPGLGDRERGPSSRAQLDDLVASLLSPGASSGPGSSREGPSSVSGLDRSTSGRTSRLSESTATTSDRDRERERDHQTRGDDSDTLHGTAAIAPPHTTTGAGLAGSVTGEVADAPGQNTSSTGLQTSSHDQAVPAAPVKPPPVTYDKGIQTVTLDESNETDNDEEEKQAMATTAKSTVATEAEIRARILKEIEMQKDIDRLEEEERRREQDNARNRDLDPADLNNILSSEDFQSFIDHSSKVVERALNDQYDYLRDYRIGDGEAGLDESGSQVKLVCTFQDSRWTQHRSVTALDWSPKFPELSVAAYNKDPTSFADPDGLACVWNLHLVDRPEFVFHSQSDVLSVAFSPFHPNLLIGGTYAGQILIWDTRAKSLPQLKSPLSAAGHTHPIYSLSIVGSQNAHNLISASTDGTICSWTLDMLARPQETLELAHPQHPKTDEVSITSMAFQGNETTTLLVGTEEGNIYAANRYDRAGAKAGLLPNETYKAHSGPVFGIDYHPLAGPIDFSDLFLSCGVDWTVRLWRSKGSSASSLSSQRNQASDSGQTISPLHTFEEANDYVLDARWHPQHPSVFGTVDAAGKFDLWNLNVDTEVPIVSTAVQSDSTRKGLNKLAWDRREGRNVALGSSDGKVYIYDVGAIATPRESEWDLLRRTIQGLASSDAVGR